MCGIVGFVHHDRDYPLDQARMISMTAALRHRGPDAHGIYIDGNIGMGHRRLSVIDLAAGQQPMVDRKTGRVIVYNGEFYNYREIRSRLEAGGTSFSTNSDTEVLLKMARFENLDWLNDINGMYAFAILDRKAGKILLCRDRLGIKPLYYSMVGGALAFASEIKALVACEEFDATVNSEAIGEYLAFRHVLQPRTLLKNVHQLPSGHAAIIDIRTLAIALRRFWYERDENDVLSDIDGDKSFSEQFESLFLDAVSLRLVGEVPLGTFNSGGVDSSLVTQQVRRLTRGELHTFSVGFNESEHDESEYSQIVAKKVGTHHHTLVMNAIEFADSLEEAIYFHDEPLAHPNSVQILQLSRLAKEFVTVALTGEGADELFAGYPRYQIPLIRDRLGRGVCGLFRAAAPMASRLHLRRLVKLLEHFDSVDSTLIHSGQFCPSSDLSALVGASDSWLFSRAALLDDAATHAVSLLEKILAYDRSTYLPALLMRLDKMTMAAGLEARVPFLDYRLLLWSKTIPPSEKIKVFSENKRILKEYAARTFPKRMIYRRKVGFGVPLAAWLRDRKSLGRYLELFSDVTFSSRGWWDVRQAHRLRDQHLASRHDHSEALWGLINLEIWLRGARKQVITYS